LRSTSWTPPQIKPARDRFMGLDTGPHVCIRAGMEFAVSARFEARHSDEV
jgi:hypothetical protein